MRKRLVDTKIGVGEMKRALFALIILMCVAAAASAAQFFTEDFSGGTLPGNMELTTHWAHPSLYGGSLTEHVDYGNNYAHWEEMTYYRQYIRTKDSDYSSVSFVFEATVTVTNASYGEVIYGMGDVTGTVGSGQPGHPCIGAMESKHSTRRYKLISTADNDDGLTDASWGNFSNANRRPNPKEAPFRVRMEWDATAKTATMSIDSNFDGIFNADQSFVISSNEVAGADGLTGGVFDASNSHLFIGGGFGVTVDDISVFPALPQEVSETALAHWRFENGEAGQTHAVDNDDWYRDVSGHANHLSSLSSSLRPLISASVPFDRVARVGPNELSLDFVGGDNVGTYNGSKMIQGYSFTDAWTIECSFNVDTANSANMVPFGKDGYVQTGINEQPFAFKLFPDSDTDGMRELRCLWWWDGANRDAITTADFVEPNKWYTAVAVYEGDSVTFYLKSEDESGFTAIGSKTRAGGCNLCPPLIDPSDNNWVVGRGLRQGVLNYFFDGKVDEVRISNIALHPSKFIGMQNPLGDMEAWTRGYGLDPYGNGDESEDPDGDGLDNLAEYALGGSPVSGDAEMVLPTSGLSGGFLEYVYNRRLDASSHGLAYGLNESTNLLGNWDYVGNAYETASIVVDPEFEVVTNAIPTAGQDQGFVDLQITGDFRFPAVSGYSLEDGSTKAEDENEVLSWDAVEDGDYYIIYFSANESLVAAGDPSISVTNYSGTTFEPGSLVLYSDYYWRVDAFSNDENIGFKPGAVHSFEPTIPSELGRGHRIFLKRGFQAGATVFPGWNGTLSYDPGTNVDWDTWTDSGFNSVHTHGVGLDNLPSYRDDLYYMRWGGRRQPDRFAQWNRKRDALRGGSEPGLCQKACWLAGLRRRKPHPAGLEGCHQGGLRPLEAGLSRYAGLYHAEWSEQ